MDAMASATGDAKEIDDAIRLGGDMAQAELNIDESELEDELKALAQEEAARLQADTDAAQAKRQQQALEQLASSPLDVPRKDGTPAMNHTEERMTALQ